MGIDDWSIYTNFVILAVCGRTGEADTVMTRFAPAIKRCAGELLKEDAMPFCGDLYRGLLLEPESVVDGKLEHQEHRTFLSWSETLDCALWFAHPGTVVSEVVKRTYPRVQSYVAKTGLPQVDQILWRSFWAPALEKVVGNSLVACAMIHPQVDHSQFRWNLETQQEVITTPMGPLEVVPVEGFVDMPPVEALEGIYCWPGARHAS